MVVIKAVKGVSQHKEDSVLSKLKELDIEKQNLRGNLRVAEKRLSRTMKGSMTEKFWKRQVQEIREKIGK